ncbi:triacylglycerol lipase OBL1-like [Tasmannia lanceolata]|uniref:triacylglycerol lipase OBL1-like n=1 Tax=Tasmannia lanceolata TaxID=3420 RepID=UPI004062DFC6
MANFGPSEYMILHPEKVGFFALFLALLFPCWKKLPDGAAEISSSVPIKRFYVILSLIGQKILLFVVNLLYGSRQKAEILLNSLSLHRDITSAFKLAFGGEEMVQSFSQSDGYRSFYYYLDGRRDLYKGSHINCIPGMKDIGRIKDYSLFELSVMASNLSYENEIYVKDVVTNTWKMHFVEFFNCYNEYQKQYTTHAFVFCDRPVNARVIVVAFRGTSEKANWGTNIEFSWLSMGKKGKIHLGFLKALGLQDEKDFQKGWPKDYTGAKPLAYYSIRETLKALIEQHKDAVIIIAGHSLGGALASLYPLILAYNEQIAILDRLWGVVTVGEPRVGDEDFCNYMEKLLNSKYKRYCRMVYKHDIVPRVPFDHPFGTICPFKHFGDCLYFSCWFKAEVLKDMPNKNYFGLLYIPAKFFNAWLDLITAPFLWISNGKDFTETWPSWFYRFLGLFIPGIAFHSVRDYLNSSRLAQLATKVEKME